jgi:iron complex outermembrane receptor protein
MLINGNSVNEDVYGSAGLGTIFNMDMEQVARIEIVKGPGSALYGTSALFAVVNVVTKDAAPGVQADVEYGSHESRRVALSYGLSSGPLNLVVSGSYRNTEGQNLYFPEYDGYVDEGGITHDGMFRDGDWDKGVNVYARASYRRLFVQGGYNSRDKGIPTAAYWTTFNDNRTKNIDELAFLEVRHQAALGGARSLLTRAYLNNYQFRGDWLMWYSDAGDYYQELGKDLAKSRAVGAELQLDWNVSKNSRLTVGTDLQHKTVLQKYWDAGLLGPDYYSVYLDDERDMDLWSFYAQDIISLSKLSFTLGLRHDHYSTFGGATNPRLGVIYSPSPSTDVKLLYGSAFRAPTACELYYEDGGYSIARSTDLKPEKLRTTEVVIEHEVMDNVRVTLSAYNTHLDEIIYQVVTDELGLEGDPLLQYRNVGSVESRGAELTLTGVVAGAHVRLGYAYQQSRDEDADREVVNSPRNLANLNLSVPVRSAGNQATLELQYVGRRLTVADEWLTDYLKTNLSLRAREAVFRTDVTVRVNNVFDISYEDAVSTEFLQTRIRQDGRTFVLALTHRF